MLIIYRCIVYNLLKYSVVEDRGYIYKNIVLNFSLLKAVFCFLLVYIKWLIVNIVQTSVSI